MFAPILLTSMLCLQGSAQEDAPEGAEPSQAELAEWLVKGTRATAGPVVGALGPHAQIQVPEGLWFADARGANTLLEVNGNLPDDRVVGAVMSLREDADWFVIFTWDESGYVEDDEKDELDADALLESMRESGKADNERRKAHGLSTLQIVGWEKKPFYDPKTNNLTWGQRLRSEEGGESINWDVRLLGRRGVMSVGLVTDPKDLAATLPTFDALIEGYQFKEGHKYAQFVPGDKIAKYGLGALVLGGAGVAAAKFGFLSKFWKFIVFGVIAVAAFLKGAWSKLFKRPREAPES